MKAKEGSQGNYTWGCSFFPKEIMAITISYRGVIMICSDLFWPDIVERKHHKAADVALSHQW
jgi:hypothetical protein